MAERMGFPAFIERVEGLTSTLRRFVLRTEKQTFPPVSPGSYAALEFGDGEKVYKNAYSIVERSKDGRELTVIVRLAPQSRGGSRFLHEKGRPELPVWVGSVANLFPIVKTARRHLLLSAGIGITPFLSYLRKLRSIGADYTLHHFCRAEERPAFEALLADQDQARVSVHTALPFEAGLADWLQDEAIATHVYFCGPEGFMKWVEETTHRCGFAPEKVHSEHFFVPEGGRPFEVILARSGRKIAVKADETLLEALEQADVDAPCMCRGGACGACAVTVLDGQPDHRDHVLTEAERASGNVILTCVSRAKTDTLTLDL